jgi:hypothetical protein
LNAEYIHPLCKAFASSTHQGTCIQQRHSVVKRGIEIPNHLSSVFYSFSCDPWRSPAFFW